MSVAFLNDTTLTNFINDTKIFEDCVKESFKKLDVDGDGYLNADELGVEFCNQSLDPMKDIYEVVCHKFQVDKNGGIDVKGFTSIIRDILLAMAQGIGNLPIQVALQQDSFLTKAVEHEKKKKGEK